MWKLSLFLLVLAAARAPARPIFRSGVRSGGEAAFLQGLASAQESLAEGDHEEAYQALRALVDEHAGERYVLAKLVPIEEDMKRALFWSDYRVPEPEDLVSGELLRYSERSGDIKVRYTDASQFDDFEAEDKNSVLEHPLTFEGSFTIEIELRSYPSRNMAGRSTLPVVELGAEDGRSIFVAFGQSKQTSGGLLYWSRASIAVGEGMALEELAVVENPRVDPGKPTVLEVRVKGRSISAYANGRKVISARAPEDVIGPCVLINVGNLRPERIEFEGKAQASWMEGVRDRHMQAARDGFDADFDVRDHLPPETSAQIEQEISGEEHEIPDPGEKGRPIVALMEEGEHERALDALGELKKSDIDHASRQLLLAILHVELEAFEEAEKAIGLLEQPLAGGFLARKLSAHVAAGLGRWDEAMSALHLLHAEAPDDPEVAEALAMLRLREGSIEGAQRVVEEAILAGAEPSGLARTHRMILGAMRGPAWPVVHEHRTKHYLIRTNLDEKAARAAGDELEAGLRHYERHLEYLPGSEEDPYVVYFFSGEEGFRRYVDRIVGQELENVAGMYAPYLKQLVVWNLPDRGNLWLTVRHEGFHQYLDRLVGDSPIWLDEGLAEYYEAMELKDGRWIHGQPHRDHARSRGGRSILAPLKSFLFQGRGRFQRSMRRNYAQAWGFVHFLLHGPSSGKKRFDSLIRELREGATPGEAVERAFEGVDWSELDAQFRDHVQSL